MTEKRSINAHDHDLLIEINTKLGRVIDDVRELKDNVATRVTELEEGKIDKVEFAKLAEVVENNRAFIDNMKGKFAIVVVVGAFVISLVTAWITKHI